MTRRRDPEIDDLIEDITTDASGDAEQLEAFLQAIEENVPVPCPASVAGSPVTVLRFGFDGNERRGLTVECRGVDSVLHRISVLDLVLPSGTPGGRYIAAYRQWSGVVAQRPRTRKPKAVAERPSGPVEFTVLSVEAKRLICRRLSGSDRVILGLKARAFFAPGEILSVQTDREWNRGSRRYASGEIESLRIDAAALGLVPLKLHQFHEWDPAREYWGDEGEPIASWARPIIAWGPRPLFEMEQILPGYDPRDPHSDPIGNAVDLKESGDVRRAEKLLQAVCEVDLRCIDAHAHLGNLRFDRSPSQATRHYEVGVRIAELSLGPDFLGVLSWGLIDNRPFLRCLQGYGLCLWRLGRTDEARQVFERMLWLNPTDNQGVRFLLADMDAGLPWRDE